MVRIRMQRFGRTHRPFYRINAIDQRTRRNGKVIERLGWYDPIATDESKKLNLNAERIRYWLDVGAQPSDTCRSIFANESILNEKEMARWNAERETARKRVEAKKAAEAEAAAAAAAAEGGE